MFWWQPKIISFQPNSASLNHWFQAYISAFHKTLKIQFTMNFQDCACIHKEKYLPLKILACSFFSWTVHKFMNFIFLSFSYILPSFQNNKYSLFIRHLGFTYFFVATPCFLHIPLEYVGCMKWKRDFNSQEWGMQYMPEKARWQSITKKHNTSLYALLKKINVLFRKSKGSWFHLIFT